MWLAGVTKFVCLMEEEERKRMRFVPYEEVAQHIAGEHGRTVEFESLPIPGTIIFHGGQGERERFITMCIY